MLQKLLNYPCPQKKELETSSALFPLPCKKVMSKRNSTDDFNKAAIRRIILNLYFTEECVPSLRKLVLKLKKDRKIKMFKSIGLTEKKPT